MGWRWAVHGDGMQCEQPMWLEERGTSADPSNTSVVCQCGKRMSLAEAFLPRRLGTCKANRPWLLDRDPDGCGEELKLLIRTATNTYFPQVATLISLPAQDDQLPGLISSIIDHFKKVTSLETLALARQFIERIDATVGGCNYPGLFGPIQPATVCKMMLKALAPGLRRAVSTTVRTSASPSADHMAR